MNKSDLKAIAEIIVEEGRLEEPLSLSQHEASVIIQSLHSRNIKCGISMNWSVYSVNILVGSSFNLWVDRPSVDAAIWHYNTFGTWR